MAKQKSTARIPIWIRVPGIIALLLAGVLVGALLLDAAGVGELGRPGHVTGGPGGEHRPPERWRDGGHNPRDGSQPTMHDQGLYAPDALRMRYGVSA